MKIKYTLNLFLLFTLLSCNPQNSANDESHKAEMRKIMADSLVTNNYLGFELGADKITVEKYIDSLEKNDNSIRYKRWFNAKKTSSSNSSVIYVEGQDVLHFQSKLYLQQDSVHITEKSTYYTLRFHNEKLFSINAEISSYGDKYIEDSILVFSNHIPKYGQWYENVTETIRSSFGYDRMLFYDDYVFRSVTEENDRNILKWSFKNVDVLLCQNNISWIAHQRATMSKIISNLVSLISSSSAVRDETRLGQDIKWVSTNEGRISKIESYIQSFDTNIKYEYYNEWAKNAIINTVSSSFNFYEIPINYKDDKYISLNYIDKNIDKFLRDSLAKVEKSVELERQKKEAEKHIRDSLIQDSIKNAKVSKFKNQNL